MYAVIKTGGKQYKVTTGDVLEVERIRLKGDGTTTALAPLLVVTDDGKTIFGTGNLVDYKVGIKMVGESKGDKLSVLKYRNKSGYQSKTGHRQRYSLIEITGIGDEKAEEQPKAAAAQEPPAAKSEKAEEEQPKKAPAKQKETAAKKKEAKPATETGGNDGS